MPAPKGNTNAQIDDKPRHKTVLVLTHAEAKKKWKKAAEISNRSLSGLIVDATNAMVSELLKNPSKRRAKDGGARDTTIPIRLSSDDKRRWMEAAKASSQSQNQLIVDATNEEADRAIKRKRSDRK